VDLEAMAQAHVNVTAGACLALALRYAGSACAAAAELIEAFLAQYINIKRQVSCPSPYSDAKVANRTAAVWRGATETGP
jgi:anaphase-promoting complex subunit 1